MPLATDFPFAAVTGQAPLKLALILAAIDPSMGGVLVSGPRGSAKSTLARGLADILPATASGTKPQFVTLPLGASEEMVTGSLDLQQVLEHQQVQFNPGLLAKAHHGVLYVDEVNLLPDPLVDLLLDVAASGVNRVERDGISHEHDAAFLLIGTMNPDEGELRPQLLDRFGLMVAMDNNYSLSERVEVVNRRQQFDTQPEQLIADFETQQRDIVDSIAAAQTLLSTAELSQSLQLEIAQRCHEANVDGLRADIFWSRAARAHAAWQGRSIVELSDINNVEGLVLVHRRRAESQSQSQSQSQPSGQSNPPNPPNPSSNAPKGKSQPPSSPASSPTGQRSGGSQSSSQASAQSSSASSTSDADSESSQTEGEWGAMEPQPQNFIEAKAWSIDDATNNANGLVKTQRAGADFIAPVNQWGRVKGRSLRGKYSGGRSGTAVDWFKSLVTSKGRWPLGELVYKKRKSADAVLHLVLLDTSGSTLNGAVLAQAKGLVESIAQQVYLARQQFALMGFGNQSVSTLWHANKAPKEISQILQHVPAGGGTPLKKALLQAQAVLKRLQIKNPRLKLQTYIVTDGRSSECVDGLRLPGHVWWLDTELATVKRGRGASIAESLGAIYTPLNAGLGSTC